VFDVTFERGTAGAPDVVDVAAAAAATVPVTAELAHRGLTPADFTVVRPTLEDVFVALTEKESDR